MNTQQTSAKRNKPLMMKLSASLLLVSIITTLLFYLGTASAADVIVYKSPTCGCCSSWIEHLEKNGFSVESRNENNMSAIKQKFGVPQEMQSCHTAQVGEYLVEGHVPADLIQRLLKEKPKAKGLAVPGMPMGSPGMEGPRKDVYDIVLFKKDGTSRTYATR